MKGKRMDRVIDTICNRGCHYVNTVLTDSRTRGHCQEFLSLNSDEQVIVIDELKMVMSVYDQTGSCEV